MSIYWDHNATSPLRPKVKLKMIEALDSYHANASSSHALGQQCRYALEETRKSFADFLHCEPSELVFTASASESNLLALWGLWLSRHKEDPKRRKIITSPIEHASVYENLLFLKEKFGAEILFAPLRSNGEIDVPAFEKMLNDEIAFCSIIGAHNETGILQPWKELAEACHAQKIPFHVDLVQCFVREPLHLKDSKASTVTLCFHKAGGPKGSGLLYVRQKTLLEPVVRGGGQEKQRRAGTENICTIVAAGALIDEASWIQKKLQMDVRAVRDYFETELKRKAPHIRIVGGEAARIANTSYVLFENFKADALMMLLDLDGICVSTGSACSSGIPKASRTIMGLGFSEAEALTGIRFSLGPDNTREEADKILHVLELALSKKKVA